MKLIDRMATVLFLTLFLTIQGTTVAADDKTLQPVNFDTSLQLTWADGNNAADDAGMAKKATPGTFKQGSWIFQAYGSGTIGDDSGEIYLGHVGFGYFLWDNISFNFEGIFGAVDSDFTAGGDADGYTLGFDLLGRWHFCNSGDLTIFAEGGIGMIWFEESFPQGGTHQNFTPQVGIGAAFRVCDEVRLMGGVRWHHVSNARKSGIDRNPGFDGAMIYGGIMIPF